MREFDTSDREKRRRWPAYTRAFATKVSDA
jgi:hypothetical protein